MEHNQRVFGISYIYFFVGDFFYIFCFYNNVLLFVICLFSVSAFYFFLYIFIIIYIIVLYIRANFTNPQKKNIIFYYFFSLRMNVCYKTQQKRNWSLVLLKEGIAAAAASHLAILATIAPTYQANWLTECLTYWWRRKQKQKTIKLW